MTNIDKSEIEAAIVRAVTKSAVDWMTTDEIQGELDLAEQLPDGAEASAHVPLQVLGAILERCVEEGFLEVEDEPDQPRRFRVVRASEGEEPTLFAQRIVRELGEAKARASRAEGQVERVRAWFRENDLANFDALFEPPPPKSTRKTFAFIQKRPIDAAERGAIYLEQLVHRQEQAVAKLRFDAAKDLFKSSNETLEAKIAALDMAAQSSERLVEIQAYKVTDWAQGVVIVRAEDDDRELAREPIPRGAQKPVPGTETGGDVVGPPIDAEGYAELGDLRGAVLEQLRASDTALELGTIVERLASRFTLPKGAQGLIKVQLSALVKEKEVAREIIDGVSKWRSIEAGGGAEEPGPLATPEAKKRGRRAGAEA